MKPTLLAAVMVVGVVSPAWAWAGSGSRYALVVGNNVGRSELDLEPLRFAEQEARNLTEHLVRYGNFDPERVELVVGKGRAEILQAAARLAERHRQDRAELGPLPTLFAIFFTGHGLSGKLLTANEPVRGEEMAALVQRMDATLTIGFFDACYSGSLDWAALKAKGAVSTPGFNLFSELPREVLDSEGTIWFVSSRAGEPSFEDEQLGGLFMHFFTEAFTAAPRDGVGATLEGMWEYAQRETAAWAMRHGRRQSPEKQVRNLKARGPVYFSFPRQRTAQLRFDRDVQGTFLLRYEQAGLVETIVKRAGEPLEVATYEGEALLSRADVAGASRQLSLAAGKVIHVQQIGAAPQVHALGFTDQPVRSKGALPSLELTEPVSRTAVEAGAGYRFALEPAGRLATSPHNLAVWVALERGSFFAALDVSGGLRSGQFEAWSYSLRQLDVRALAGWGFDLGGPRLDVAAIAGPRFSWVRYGSGATRAPLGAWTGGGLRLCWPVPSGKPSVTFSATAAGGALWSQGIAIGATRTSAAPAGVLELALGVPLTRE